MAMREAIDPNDPMQRKALIDQLGGDAAAPAVEPQSAELPAQGAGVEASPVAPPSAQHYNTRLLEGDESKFTPEHEAESPKYEFLDLGRSGKYNYDQMGDMLKELQGGKNGARWQDWVADGHGNLDYTGDPSKLAKEWNGVTHVDAAGSYGSGADSGDWSKTGFRWGIEPGGGQPQPEAAAGPAAGGGGMGDIPLSGGVPTDTGFFKKIMESLQSQTNPAASDRQALLAQMRMT